MKSYIPTRNNRKGYQIGSLLHLLRQEFTFQAVYQRFEKE